MTLPEGFDENADDQVPKRNTPCVLWGGTPQATVSAFTL
jgi:hypothetical protein